MDYTFVGIKKGEKDDLETKIGLAKDRVLTENMKLSAVEAIRKFYYEKGYRNVTIDMDEQDVSGIANAGSITFTINKGNKLRINYNHFAENETMSKATLKKQMKGKKVRTRMNIIY